MPKMYFKPVLIFVLVASFLAYEMAIQVSPGVITKQLMVDLKIDALGLGLMAGCYFYTYTLMQVPAGLILDRYSLSKIIILPIIICAVGVILFGLSSSIIQASIARMLIGAGSAFAFIAVLVVAADIFPAKHFALLAGLTQLLAALGAMVGGWPLVPFFTQLGWRPSMIGLGILGLSLVILIALWGRYPKPNHQTGQKSTKFSASLKVILSNAQTWYLASYACLLWAPMAAFASLWGIPYLQETYSLSASSAAVLNSLLWLGIALGSPLIGWWSDRMGKRKLPLACAAALGLNTMAAILYCNQLPLWLISILLFLTGAACSGQALSFAMVKENNLPSNNAAAIGFNNMAVVIAGAIFQPMIGKLIQSHAPTQLGQQVHYASYDFQFGLSILPFCFGLALFISLFFIRETLNKVRSS
jgi:MFS family permease